MEKKEVKKTNRKEKKKKKIHVTFPSMPNDCQEPFVVQYV